MPKAHPDLIEEKDLPQGLQDVNPATNFSSIPPTPIDVEKGPNFTVSSSPLLQHDSAFTKTSYVRAGIPSVPLMPLPTVTPALVQSIAHNVVTTVIAGGGGGGGSIPVTGPLTNHDIIIGTGVGIKALGSLGTLTTVLHGNPVGDPAFGSVVENDIFLVDVTTNNATTLAHGFLPKLSGIPGQFLNGSGVFVTPTVALAASVEINSAGESVDKHVFINGIQDGSVPAWVFRVNGVSDGG